MFKYRFFYVLICFFLFQFSYSQKDSLIVNQESTTLKTKKVREYIPAKAAFYSAILPGLGQGYNGKYWKIPIVYAALGTSIYAYSYNNDKYNQYRDAFKLEESGKPHEFDGEDGNLFLSREGLMRAQEKYKEDRDLSFIITFGIYILQIVEASVNAHLLQMNTIDNVSFNPKLIIDPNTKKMVSGLSLSYKF